MKILTVFIIHQTRALEILCTLYQIRYENGGFYLTIDNIKGYVKLDDNISGNLDMILIDDQKNKYYQVWKEVFKLINDENGKLKLHED